jgi:GH24 family phage-related lysozyme (muramidase)
MRKINKSGLNLIKKYEGCRLTSYICPAGVLTIGYGHTGKDVKPNQTISKKKAISLLKKDLARFERHVQSYNYIYEWTDNEFSALVSFAYNIGNIDQLTAYGTRTRSQIRSAMLKYVKANGKTLPGLVKRRKAELKLFNR